MNYQKLACLGGSLALALLAPACGGDDDNSGKNKDGGIPIADGGVDASLVCPAGGTGQVRLAVVVPCNFAGSTVIGDAGAPDGGSVDAGGVDGGATECTTTLTTAGAFMPQVRLNGGSLAAPAAFALGQPLSVTAGPNFVLEARRVTTHPAAGSAAIVGKAFAPTLMPFDGCIKAGEMRTVTVVYTQEPGSEKLWITTKNATTPLVAFAPPALAATGSPAPVIAGFKHTNQQAGLALDPFGNLWVADPGIPEKLVMYPVASLGTQGAAPPAVVLTGAAVPRPQALAFDDVGNLWVANGGTTGAITQIAASALLTSGQPVPLTKITSPSMQAPEELAFDAQGNLWVASSGNNSVLKFNKARLAANFAGPADVLLTAAQVNPALVVTYGYRSPQSLAFDRGGNLWVGFYTGSHIVRFTPADLAASKQVNNPLFKETTPQASLVGLTMDEQGGLWFPANVGVFARLSPEDLATTGTSPAQRVITVGQPTLGSAVKLLFNPTPAGLPIPY